MVVDIPLINPDLSPRETIHQITDVLDHLDKATATVFDRIGERINANLERVAALGVRIEDARAKVAHLKNTKRSAAIFSDSKYPGRPYTDYEKATLKNDGSSVVPPLNFSYTKKQDQDLIDQFSKKSLDKRDIHEKLLFYHVRSKNKIKLVDTGIESSFRSVPKDIKSSSSLLVFDTSELAYKTFHQPHSHSSSVNAKTESDNSTTDASVRPKQSVIQDRKIQKLSIDQIPDILNDSDSSSGKTSPRLSNEIPSQVDHPLLPSHSSSKEKETKNSNIFDLSQMDPSNCLDNSKPQQNYPIDFMTDLTNRLNLRRKGISGKDKKSPIQTNESSDNEDVWENT